MVNILRFSNDVWRQQADRSTASPNKSAAQRSVLRVLQKKHSQTVVYDFSTVAVSLPPTATMLAYLCDRTSAGRLPFPEWPTLSFTAGAYRTRRTAKPSVWRGRHITVPECIDVLCGLSNPHGPFFRPTDGRHPQRISSASGSCIF